MFRPKQITRQASAILTAGLTLIASTAIFAQETDQSSNATDAIEEVVVTGTRATVQRSIDLKRNSTQIVDGLSAEEIGDIPALSIGAALETITGATSHRENGGATELSVRGLGPFLGTTVVNGREATNGGGNRAVNFSIFPSEMFNKIAIHKTQSAEYIEGAVSGQVHLDTKKPLDYGKRLLQANIKLAHSPDETNIQGGQDYGSRATFSYIDQFDFDSGARLGVSIGVQARDETNPEQEYNTTTGGGRLEACELTSFDANALPTDTNSSSLRCYDSDAGVSNSEVQALLDDPANNYNSVEDIPFAYIPRDHRYRQNTTDDEREAVFGSIQFQPNDRLDVTLDFQYSERDQREMRKDMQIANAQRNVSELTSNPATGVVYSSVFDSQFYSYTTDFQRLEEYEGYGINFDYALTDNLSLRLDYAASDTARTETDVELRLAATDDNTDNGGSYYFPFQLDVNQGPGAGIATILDDGGNGFEVTDPSYFNSANRGRIRARQVIRDNTMDALRADLKWTRDSGALHTVKAGLRSSSMEYFTRGGLRNDRGKSLFEVGDLTTPDGGADNAVTDAVLANVLACADQSFPESSFLSNVRDGELITNASSGTAVSSFATFNFDCAANAWLANYGGLAGIQFQNSITSATNDVTEDTLAFYVQADFDTEFSGYPVRGNFGIRVVDTDITSVGYRGPITVEEIDGVGFVISEGSTEGGFETDTQKSDYQEVLPSLTVIVDLADDLILRSGIFRGMSRPDPNAYGNGRTLQPNTENNAYASLAQAVNGIGATGNPYLKPILSTNVDLGLEWYANNDTMVAGAIYWKEFNGGFETVAQLESFNLDGNQVQGFVETTQISDKDSTIKGIELSLTHAFDYLPGFWSGFGGKFSYNYADSDFEFEDQQGGDGVAVEVDQVTGEATTTPLIGILPPANLFGLSKHVTATQLYWGDEKWNVEAFYKTRSNYYQQYTRDTQGRIRYTDDNERLDLKVRYKLFDNVDVTLEAKNILDEPRIDYRAVQGNILQALSYGPRYFLGVRVKL